jgi:site-specific DNA recombinase
MIQRSSNEAPSRIRCAIYTRKSTEEGLEQEFNTLDAQREAAEAYITSQRHEGWTALPDRYDDGGYTGGNMERPALRQLLVDIAAGKVDCVIVYKVDRLSRSLMDFTQLMALFDQHKVSFVSVTQQFNTTTSMGRLTLNILLSFAQFEREIGAERVRDKIAAAKRKGKHTGGPPVLGYDIDAASKLVINPEEARLVRTVFKRFIQLGSPLLVARDLNARGVLSKAWMTKKGRLRKGETWNHARVYRLITNRKYLGEVPHKGKFYPGEHEAIIDRRTFDAAQAIIRENSKVRGAQTRAETPALLKSLLRCGHCGTSMGISFVKKRDKLYRYYVCVRAAKSGYDSCPVRSLPAAAAETAVIGQLRAIFRSPEMIARTYRSAVARAAEDPAMQVCLPTEADVRQALMNIDPVWEVLFPKEQERIVRLLVEKVIVTPGAIEVIVRTGGLESLVAELEGTASDARGREVSR